VILDIVVGLAVLAFLWMGAADGTMAGVWHIGVLAVSGILARLAVGPTAVYIIKAVEWSESFTRGIMFLGYLVVFVLIAWGLLGGFLRSARNNAPGYGIDRLVGGLLGAIRGALLVYVLLASVMLITHRLGAQKPSMAFKFQKSRVGRFVLTRNLVDNMPFPHARTLRALVGLRNGGFKPGDPYALGVLGGLPEALFLNDDATIKTAITQNRWKVLRKDQRVLDLVCSAEFLTASNAYETPNLKVEAENPEERFKELRGP